MNEAVFLIIAIIAVLIGLKIIKTITMFYIKLSIIACIILGLIVLHLLAVQ